MPGVYLEIRTADGAQKVEVGDKPITIGRHPDNLVVLTDDLASRFHCVIEKTAKGLMVRDLNSKNGTRVNGKLISAERLLPGDIVNVGRAEVTLIVPDAPAAPKAHNQEAAEISDEELVELEPASQDGLEILPEVEVEDADPEQVMLQLCESLPDKRIEETDIVLINARGQVGHAAPDPKRRRKREAVDLFRLLMLICFRTRATDVHLEPRNEDYQVRIRIDGTMVDVARFDKQMGTKLAAVVKVLSDIDIAQRNIIQEGHFAARLPDRRVDYRVSFAPAMFGQKLVVRVLDTANAPLHLADLGMPDWMQEEVHRIIEQEAGMVLVCGPTGSGKTTTLYSLMRTIDTTQRNTITIEDPVEIQLEGVTQIPVNETQGNTFSSLLRSVLRQDPDVILVGEIRDPETARIAMQAAITGHLVFSTIHTKDTVGSIFRLLDLGVEPYMVAQGLHLVIAQRLVRQLCPYCRLAEKPKPEQLARMGKCGEGVQRLYVPSGCPRCLSTGYAGRRAFFELLTATDELRDVVLKNPNMQEIYQSLSGTRFRRLAQTGYQLVADGITSIDEIDRAVGK